MSGRTHETLCRAVEDGVATITLSRPDKLNALAVQMIDEMEGVVAFLQKRAAVFPDRVSTSTDMPDFFPWWEEPPYA